MGEIDLQNSAKSRKIQLTIAISFSSKDVNEEHVMHAKSGNVEFMSYSNVIDIVDELFESLRSRYHGNLETSMEGSDFLFVSF